jgi:SAM-dependent methyltransferase
MEKWVQSFERSVEDWHWWYSVRREILNAKLSELGLDPATARLLDVGCGTGASSLVLSRFGHAVGMDRDPQFLELSAARPYAERVVGEAEHLPFPDESFDAVAALDVLEHLEDDVAGAREIRRVLKPGGSAILFVPALAILWGRNDVTAHHKRRYTKEALRRTLTDAGLRPGPVGYFNMVLFLPTLAARLAERVFPTTVGDFEYRTEPSLTNTILEQVFRLELPVLRRKPLPIGTSAFCVAAR